MKPDIWMSMCVFRREEVYLETREGSSALYKTTEGRAAFARAVSIGEQMGLSRHRNVSRCHVCLWKTKASSARSCCPWASGAPIVPKRAQSPPFRTALPGTSFSRYCQQQQQVWDTPLMLWGVAGMHQEAVCESLNQSDCPAQ